MRRHEPNRNFSAGQTHREIFDTAALGKKFGLAWEPETDFVHPGFVNGAGYNCIQLTAAGQRYRFFEGGCGGARSFLRWLAWLAIRVFADNPAFSGAGDAIGLQGKIDDLGSDTGAIAKRDSDS